MGQLHSSAGFFQEVANISSAAPRGRVLFSKIYGCIASDFYTGGLQFERFPTPLSFSSWKTNFKTGVCFGSGHPAEAIPWIRKIELARSIDDRETAQSIAGRVYANFETVDAKIALRPEEDY